MTVGPFVRPFSAGSPFVGAGSASVRGRRQFAADATAVAGRGAGLVAVVADGIGDSPAAALAARTAADTVVSAAPRLGTLDAVLAAGAAVRRTVGAGDAVLVAAAGLPGGGWSVSWVGDCRALLWDGRTLRRLTHDHTVGAALRGLGVAVAGYDHVVTTTVRKAGPAAIGHLTGPSVPGTLVLLSDGVHRHVTPAAVGDMLQGSPAAAARALVDTALAGGTRDNATAVVLPLPPEWVGGARVPHDATTLALAG